MASYNHHSYHVAEAVEGRTSDAIRDYRQFVKLGRLLGASALLFGSLKSLPSLTQRATANLSVPNYRFVAFVVANVIILYVFRFSYSAAASSSSNNTKQTDSSSSSSAAASSSSDNTKETDSSPSSSFHLDTYREHVSRSLKEAQDVSLLEEDATTVDDDGLVPVTPPVSEEFHRYRRTESVVTEDFEGKFSIDDNEAGSTIRKSSGGKKKQRRPETVREKEKPAGLERTINFNQPRKSITDINGDEFNVTVEPVREKEKPQTHIETQKEEISQEEFRVMVETFLKTNSIFNFSSLSHC
ncbi:hypothetical protein LINGRAHAP2_LOCUS12453 [Linum grandiflorum]